MKIASGQPANFRSGKSRPNVPRYASVFWLCEPRANGDGARVTIGWSVALDSSLNQHPGAWGFDVQSNIALSGRTRELPFVEEIAGVLYADVSEKTRELNDRTERLIADHLLVFAHRVLFKQGGIPGIPSAFEPVDCLLIHGPRLPKLIGRLCYSHLDRTKLISILAPRRGFGSPPRMSADPWQLPNSHPDPPFYDDSAVRRWEAPSISESTPDKSRIAGFDLVIATGDGFGGSLRDAHKVGQSLWEEKAKTIEDLLEADGEPLRIAIWQNFPVRLPLGMHRAVTAAVIEMMSRRGSELWKSREAEIRLLTSAQRKEWQLMQQHLTSDKEIPEALRELAFCAATDELKRRGPLGDAMRLAARAGDERKKIADAVKAILKNQVGESIFLND